MPATLTPPNIARTPALPAAPPSKPAPRTEAAPTNPPASVPPSEHEPAETDFLGDIGKDLAELENDTSESRAAKEPPKRGQDGRFTKPEDRVADKPKDAPEAKSEPEKAKTEPEPEKPPTTMRELGKRYDDLKDKVNKELTPKLQKAESEVARLVRENEQLKQGQIDPKPIQDRASALEKENAALRDEIRYVNYQKHPEFTEKYVKPYEEAWAKASSEVQQLRLTLEDGSVRRATENDLLALANAPLDQLDDLAEKQFGKSAPRVIRHVEKIRDLAEAQEKALADAKKGAEGHSKAVQEQSQKAAQEFQGAFTAANADIPKKYPKWFAPVEGDEKGNAILKQGFEYADAALSNNGNLTPQQKAGRIAVMRNKSANHDRLVSWVKARDARIAELEAELKQYTESTPPTDEAGSPSSEPGGDPYGLGPIEAELKKLDR